MCVIYLRENPSPEGRDEHPNIGSGPLGLCGGHAGETFQLLYDLIEERGIREREEYQ